MDRPRRNPDADAIAQSVCMTRVTAAIAARPPRRRPEPAAGAKVQSLPCGSHGAEPVPPDGSTRSALNARDELAAAAAVDVLLDNALAYVSVEMTAHGGSTTPRAPLFVWVRDL